ncbi:MAG: transcriptional regulator [Hyphococcus sp.]|nr:MAG: transcriptional regulator [Marinicaulis sp.]
MTIVIKLDVMLAEKKMKSKDLAAQLGVTEANLSKLKSGRVKGVKFETLDRICEILDCEPGDIIARK